MRHPFIIIILCLGAFFFNPATGYSQESFFRNSISIVQKNKAFSFRNNFDTVTLSKDSFSIQFESSRYDESANKLYATQIAAVTQDSCFKYLQPGMEIEKICFFSNATGLAAEEFGYSNLFIDNEAHHYVTYTDEKERRAELLSVNNDTLRLKWTVPLAFYEGKDYEFSKLPFKRFYLVFLNDSNLNEIVDEGEFLIVEVTLG